MDGLIEFLRARLDEDEGTALATLEPLAIIGMRRGKPLPRWKPSGNGRGVVDSDGGRVRVRDAFPAEVEHIARHDPARALREVKAKRRLLDEHGNVNDGSCDTCVDGTWGYPTHGGSIPQHHPCRTLRLLAAVHADHPEYRQEWAP